MVKIGSNISSLQAQRRLAEGNNTLSRTLERLASGMRINRASDDAAGLSIASSLNADSRSLLQASRNVQDGLSALNIADGALAGLSDVVIRLKELAEQASNGVYSDRQRTALDNEAQALRNEYNRIIGETEFNGVKLFDPATPPLQLQVGIDGSASSIISFDLGKALERNVGDGTFQAGNLLVGGFIAENQVGDLDGDGDLDILYSEFAGGGRMFVLRANGDGTFQAPVPYAAGAIRGLYLTDFNGDGKLDALSVNDQGAGSVRVMIGNGNGTFMAPNLVATFGDSYEASVGDLNNDGILDIAVHGITPTSAFGVLLGTGNGTFAPIVTYVATGGYGSGIGDFNNDGKADLVTGSRILFGNGDGTFNAEVNIPGLSNDGMSPITITLEQAIELLKQPKRRGRQSAPKSLKELGMHPVTNVPLVIKSGRYGPYVTDGTINASLQRGQDPNSLTVEDAVNLLNARAAKIAEDELNGGGSKKRKKASPVKKKQAASEKKEDSEAPAPKKRKKSA